MPYGEGWLEKGVQYGDLFLNYIAFGIKPNIIYDKTVPYGTLNKNKTVPYGKPIIFDKTVPYGTLEENTNG